jgi:hypothetical protein
LLFFISRRRFADIATFLLSLSHYFADDATFRRPPPGYALTLASAVIFTPRLTGRRLFSPFRFRASFCIFRCRHYAAAFDRR